MCSSGIPMSDFLDAETLNRMYLQGKKSGYTLGLKEAITLAVRELGPGTVLEMKLRRLFATVKSGQYKPKVRINFKGDLK